MDKIDPELQVIQDILTALGQVAEPRKKYILEFVSEKLGITKVNAVETSEAEEDLRETKTASKVDFFAELSSKKPSDNVLAIAAYSFSHYGSEPFSIKEIESESKDVGVSIPDNPRMTIRNASYKGKKLFVGVGKGYYKPTVHGEKYFMDKYNVKKGKKEKSKVE